MTNIEIKKDWPIKRMNELEKGPKNFSISKYINEHFYILEGDTIDATFELDQERGIQIVKDWFGESAKIW